MSHLPLANFHIWPCPAESAETQGVQSHESTTESDSPGNLSAELAAAAVESNNVNQGEQEGDEEEQSKRNAQPGALARIMKRCVVKLPPCQHLHTLTS